MSRSKRFKISFFFGTTLVILAIGFLASGHIFQSDVALSEDSIIKIEKGDLDLAVVATGSIVPVATVEVKSKASGLIKSLLVEEGNLVVSGQILIELDKELLQAQLREAEANRLAIVAHRQEAESDHSSAVSMKQKLKLDLQNLEANLAFHKKQVRRYETLFEEKLIAHSELDQRERDVQEASFAFEALKSELLMQDSRIAAAEKAVVRVKAEVSQAEATLDRAWENLRYATIRSPMAGTVLKRHVEVGDAVSSILQLGSQATLLLTLGDMNEVFFEGRVDETDIGKVFEGQKAQVRVDAFRDDPLPGNVIRIAPLGEEEDNVIGFEVRVSINDKARILRAQMSANAEIIVEEKREVLIIPEKAIIYDKDRKTFAELFDPEAEGQKRRTPIEIGISNGTRTQVTSGLREGDRVVKIETGGLI